MHIMHTIYAYYESS